MSNVAIPVLSHGEGSWIASKGSKVYELWTRQDAQRTANHGWKVETIGAYLARLRNESRDAEVAPKRESLASE